MRSCAVCVICAVCLLSFGSVAAQNIVQQHFPNDIPAGNYSGICAIGNNRYAVVSDKSEEDGFFIFHIELDTINGRIASVQNEGFCSSGQKGGDLEAICFCPETQTLFIASEARSEVKEYALSGKLTGRQLQMPDAFRKANKNYGLEALTYDVCSRQFLTTTEHPLAGDTLHRIQTFGIDMRPGRQYLYKADAPLSSKHVYGVSELCAVGDGRLLVLERQVLIPQRKIGARTRIRIYEVTLGEQVMLEKRLIGEFTTKLNLFNRGFANYEGLCLMSPHHLLLIADSQNQYAGVLRDWFMVMKW